MVAGIMLSTVSKDKTDALEKQTTQIVLPK